MNKIKFIIFSIAVIFLSACNSNTSDAGHEWLTNLEDAYKLAKQNDKVVFVLFTGSDWCPPCKKLHHDILESDQFMKFANDNLVLVELDFPRKKENKLSIEQSKYNQNLSRKFHVRGFPSVILLDANGNELNRWVGYRPTDVETMIDKYKSSIK